MDESRGGSVGLTGESCFGLIDLEMCRTNLQLNLKVKIMFWPDPLRPDLTGFNNYFQHWVSKFYVSEISSEVGHELR